jgi:RND superfamily putative drug exporter
MITLAKFSIRRPKLALITWLAVAVVLSLIGLGVANSLSPSVTVVAGTNSSRAQQLANARFGPTQLVPILLEGPRAQLNVQGPALVRALSRRPHTRVLSAWDTGTASAGLRPRPNAAMIVVSVDRSEKTVVATDQPQIERLVAATTKAPVHSFITGQPSIDRALRSASLDNLRRTELIAIGILFLLTILGLRSIVAAALVTAVGAISMLAGFGEVAVLGHVIALDPIGVALGTMTGLALGVGFALLILDRFHRESHRDTSAEIAQAAIRELETTGRAVLIGGSAIVLALLLVAVVGPMALLVSVGTGMVACAAFATGGAVVVMPAALVLLGHRVEALSFPAPAPLTRAWARMLEGGNWVTRHAVGIGFVATAVLAGLAVPAFALRSGPPDVSQLPASAKARIAFQEITRVMGPGWATPFNLIVVARNRPLTSPALLASVEQLQQQIADSPTVASVVGPGAINVTASQLKSFGPQLQHSANISDQSRRDLLKLINGLGQAGAGSKQLRSGLSQAATGAGALQSGSGQAQSGAGQLHDGLSQAKAGSSQLSDGLNQALTGAQALEVGARQALTGSNQLLQGVGLAQGPAAQSLPALNSLAAATAHTSAALAGAPGQAQSTRDAIGAAQSALNGLSAAKSDPGYQAAVAALSRADAAAGSLNSTLGDAASSAAGAKGLASSIAYQAPGLVAALNMVHDGAAQLQAGIGQLHNGNAQLATGISKLSGGGSQLSSGLSQLTAGSAALQSGLGQLTNGAGQLASGLGGGVGPAGQLTTGLGTMQAAVTTARGQLPSTADLRKLQRESPGLFNSGYFVLAAVAGAKTSDRTAASFTINLANGGDAGQIVIVSRYAASDPRSVALGDRIARLGARFGRAQNAAVAVGGPAGNLGDLTSTTQARLPLDIVIIALAIMLVLAVATRAVLIPVVTTVFALLVAAATFGVLQLLFGGSAPALGGPGYLDPISIAGIFTVVFAVTITHASLLLMRTREAFVAGAEAGAAVATGLRETAAAATGAGLIMVAALIPFATTDLLNVRAFGLGVAVAILLDVLIVRPVLLPAAVAVLGPRGWWPTHAASLPGSPTRTGARRPRRAHPATTIGAPR